MARPLAGGCTLLLALLALAAPLRAAGAPPERRGGTATVKVTGTHTAQGSFPCTCGPYLMADVQGVGKAGDGLVFATELPGLGGLQVSSKLRKPGRSADSGMVLNAVDASYLGDVGKEAEVSYGPDLWSATLKARMKPMRPPRKGETPKVIQVEARFDCTKK